MLGDGSIHPFSKESSSSYHGMCVGPGCAGKELKKPPGTTWCPSVPLRRPGGRNCPFARSSNRTQEPMCPEPGAPDELRVVASLRDAGKRDRIRHSSHIH